MPYLILSLDERASQSSNLCPSSRMVALSACLVSMDFSSFVRPNLRRFCSAASILAVFALALRALLRLIGVTIARLFVGFAPLFHGEGNGESFAIFRAGGWAGRRDRGERHNFRKLVMGRTGLACADIGVQFNNRAGERIMRAQHEIGFIIGKFGIGVEFGWIGFGAGKYGHLVDLSQVKVILLRDYRKRAAGSAVERHSFFKALRGCLFGVFFAQFDKLTERAAASGNRRRSVGHHSDDLAAAEIGCPVDFVGDGCIRARGSGAFAGWLVQVEVFPSNPDEEEVIAQRLDRADLANGETIYGRAGWLKAVQSGLCFFGQTFGLNRVWFSMGGQRGQASGRQGEGGSSNGIFQHLVVSCFSPSIHWSYHATKRFICPASGRSLQAIVMRLWGVDRIFLAA